MINAVALTVITTTAPIYPLSLLNLIAGLTKWPYPLTQARQRPVHGDSNMSERIPDVLVHQAAEVSSGGQH